MFGRAPTLPADLLFSDLRFRPKPEEEDTARFAWVEKTVAILTDAYAEVRKWQGDLIRRVEDSHHIGPRHRSVMSGDRVYVWQPNIVANKLQHKWTGPYLVQESTPMGVVTYYDPERQVQRRTNIRRVRLLRESPGLRQAPDVPEDKKDAGEDAPGTALRAAPSPPSRASPSTQGGSCPPVIGNLASSSSSSSRVVPPRSMSLRRPEERRAPPRYGTEVSALIPTGFSTVQPQRLRDMFPRAQWLTGPQGGKP